jgi:hypothetical protein
MEDALLRIYSDPESPGGLGGTQALYEAAKEAGVVGVSQAKVRRFLRTLDLYVAQAPARKRYARDSIQAHYAGHVVQADIMDLSRWKESNDQYRYILLLICTCYLMGCPI